MKIQCKTSILNCEQILIIFLFLNISRALMDGTEKRVKRVPLD